jgi:hypothetical protein
MSVVIDLKFPHTLMVNTLKSNIAFKRNIGIADILGKGFFLPG